MRHRPQTVRQEKQEKNYNKRHSCVKNRSETMAAHTAINIPRLQADCHRLYQVPFIFYFLFMFLPRKSLNHFNVLGRNSGKLDALFCFFITFNVMFASLSTLGPDYSNFLAFPLPILRLPLLQLHK